MPITRASSPKQISNPPSKTKNLGLGGKTASTMSKVRPSYSRTKKVKKER